MGWKNNRDNHNRGEDNIYDRGVWEQHIYESPKKHRKNQKKEETPLASPYAQKKDRKTIWEVNNMQGNN